MAQRGLEYAYEALFDVIKGINGAAGGYWTDLGGRVYTDLKTPPESSRVMPYACMPVIDTGDYPETTGSLLRMVLRQPVVIFLPQLRVVDRVEGSGAQQALRMHSDVVRAVFADESTRQWNLANNGIQDVSLNSKSLQAASGDGLSWDELGVVIDLAVIAAHADLGPLAIAA